MTATARCTFLMAKVHRAAGPLSFPGVQAGISACPPFKVYVCDGFWAHGSAIFTMNALINVHLPMAPITDVHHHGLAGWSASGCVKSPCFLVHLSLPLPGWGA